MQQAAYNLKEFENREPRIRVAKPAKKITKKRNLASVRTAAAGVLLLALVFSVLYTRAQSTELTSQITAQQTSLANLQSEYDYLNRSFESALSLDKVELYAEQELGMIKMDKSQIEYISLKTQDNIVCPADKNSLWMSLKSSFMNMMEYIVP